MWTVRAGIHLGSHGPKAEAEAGGILEECRATAGGILCIG